MNSLIKRIHESPYKAVIATTGGGSGAFDMLLKNGGGSATLLDGRVPYDQKALEKFLHGRPDKFCSAATARDMAMAAYCEARALTDDKSLVGVGCTASLVKSEEREGRTHTIHVATQTYEETTWFTLRLKTATNDYNLTRSEEEDIAAKAIIIALADACKVLTKNDIQLLPTAMLPFILRSNGAIYDNRRCCITSPISVVNARKLESVRVGRLRQDDEIIFAGSFNPIHEQHIRMAQTAYEMTGKRINLEVCIRNVDKPALNYCEISDRITDLLAAVQNYDWFSGIYLTNAGTFADKSDLFPNSTFMMGWDVYRRMNDSKYGDLNAVVWKLMSNRAKFLLFHRIIDGTASHETEEFAEMDIWTRPEIFEVTTIVPPDKIVISDISSSTIRKTT